MNPSPDESISPVSNTQGTLEQANMWTFESLRDALIAFTDLGSAGCEYDEEAEAEAEESETIADFEDEEEEEDGLEMDPDLLDQDELEAIGRFPTLQQLRQVALNATEFWTRQLGLFYEQSLTEFREPDLVSDQEDGDIASEAQIGDEIEQIGRLPSLQQLQSIIGKLSGPELDGRFGTEASDQSQWSQIQLQLPHWQLPQLQRLSTSLPRLGLPKGVALPAGFPAEWPTLFALPAFPTLLDIRTTLPALPDIRTRLPELSSLQMELSGVAGKLPSPPNPSELLAKWRSSQPDIFSKWRTASTTDTQKLDLQHENEHEHGPIHDTQSGIAASEVDQATNEFHLSKEELEKTYGSDGGLGCRHYLRNCKVECPECHHFYTCRLCHDENESHVLPRHLVKNMLCMACSTPQPAAEYCFNCRELMAEYYCEFCRLWSDDPERPVFHCDECGICRVGHGLGIDTFHCTTCGICMDLAMENNHKCVANSPQSDCPICLEDLFNSTKPIVIMPCGHPIHKHCFDDYTKTFYRCPVCSRSVLDTSALFRLIEDEVRREILPEELQGVQIEIRCNDCHMRTHTPFHLAGLKCSTCGSYNTTKI